METEKLGTLLGVTLPRNWLWFAVNLLALLPVLWTLQLLRMMERTSAPLMFATGVTQEVLLFTGKTALIFLVLSLACTPAARLLGWRQAIAVRKSLGLWGFGFACFHALFFLGGKELFFSVATWRDLRQWVPTIFVPGWMKTPFAAWGAMALMLLLPLALTSNRFSMRTLGKGWKWLHRLVYLAVPLAVFHYWRRAVFYTDQSAMGQQSNYRLLALLALLVSLLLLVRIPFVRRQWVQLGQSRTLKK